MYKNMLITQQIIDWQMTDVENKGGHGWVTTSPSPMTVTVSDGYPASVFRV